MSQPKKILITSGDQDGIGPEVCLKTLSKVAVKSGLCLIYLVKSLSTAERKKIAHLKPRYLNSWPKSLKTATLNEKLVVIQSSESPALWVEHAARLLKQKKIDALVTGPLSKPVIRAAGLSDLGHTDILKRIFSAKDLFMGFVGDQFSVVLATGHIPIEKVQSQLSYSRLKRAVDACGQLKSFSKTSARKIAVLGLNPHAGDAGLIGSFENKHLKPWIRRLQKAGYPVVGPLVPDAAFMNRAEPYLCYLCLYHDQGLIPFKALHGLRGVHITLGLKALRTSVDHGTAKDIFGKNKADPSSMIEALSSAMKFVTKTL